MSGKKIFIVDDDADFIAGTKVVLESAGYQVFAAGKVREALEKIGEAAPDLIIMDVMLEKMSDGFDLSRKLKSDEKYKKIPILMVTAVGEKTGFRYSPDSGDKLWLPVDEFMEKPVASDVLTAKVAKLLGK